jgi:hypothetical protein
MIATEHYLRLRLITPCSSIGTWVPDILFYDDVVEIRDTTGEDSAAGYQGTARCAGGGDGAGTAEIVRELHFFETKNGVR